MQTIYNNQQYLQNNPSWHEEDAAYKAEQVLQLLQKHNLKFENITEVGCGSGEILVQLSKNLHQVKSFTGYDISQNAIEIALPKANEKIQFYCKDFTKENEQADLLLVMDVIEHIENYFQFLRDIQPKSKYTVFHIPLDMCVWALFREGILLESKERVGHIHNFTESFVKQILTESGFDIVQCIYTKPLYHQSSFKEKFIHYIRKALFAIHPKFATKTMGGFSILVLTKNRTFS